MPRGASGVALDSHQELITKLYHIERRPLKEVVGIIKEKFNINVSFVGLQEMSD
jgi:uncharacterized protein YlxP (DUF503 family)